MSISSLASGKSCHLPLFIFPGSETPEISFDAPLNIIGIPFWSITFKIASETCAFSSAPIRIAQITPCSGFSILGSSSVIRGDKFTLNPDSLSKSRNCLAYDIASKLDCSEINITDAGTPGLARLNALSIGSRLALCATEISLHCTAASSAATFDRSTRLFDSSNAVSPLKFSIVKESKCLAIRVPKTSPASASTIIIQNANPITSIECLYLSNHLIQDSILDFFFTSNGHLSSKAASSTFGSSSKTSANTATTTKNAQTSAKFDQNSADAKLRSIWKLEVMFWITEGLLVTFGVLVVIAFAILGKRRFWS